jgi:hypothetical protein
MQQYLSHCIFTDAFQMKYTTMDLLPFIVAETVFTNKVNIPQSASAFITSPQTIISPGYPFAYHTDFFFMWSINFQNGFVSLQFTDIHLKEKVSCHEYVIPYNCKLFKDGVSITLWNKWKKPFYQYPISTRHNKFFWITSLFPSKPDLFLS